MAVAASPEDEPHTGGFWRFLDLVGCRTGWRMARYALDRAEREENLSAFYRRLEFPGRAGYTPLQRRMDVVRSNLELVFPEWSRVRVERVVFEAVMQLCRGFGDLCQWARRRWEETPGAPERGGDVALHGEAGERCRA